jgi:hypothetical protein
MDVPLCTWPMRLNSQTMMIGIEVMHERGQRARYQSRQIVLAGVGSNVVGQIGRWVFKHEYQTMPTHPPVSIRLYNVDFAGFHFAYILTST